MKRIGRMLGAALALALLMGMLTGCFPFLQIFKSKDERLLGQAMEQFFAALEERDAEALVAQFAPSVAAKDSDLSEQLGRLMEIYPTGATRMLTDVLPGTEREMEDGMVRSWSYDTVAVRCEGKLFWVYMELVWEDDYDAQNLGLRSVYVYTADEYCAFFHDEEAASPEEAGLLVFADLELEREVRAIEGLPYAYTAPSRDPKGGQVSAETGQELRSLPRHLRTALRGE